MTGIWLAANLNNEEDLQGLRTATRPFARKTRFRTDSSRSLSDNRTPQPLFKVIHGRLRDDPGTQANPEVSVVPPVLENGQNSGQPLLPVEAPIRHHIGGARDDWTRFTSSCATHRYQTNDPEPGTERRPTERRRTLDGEAGGRQCAEGALNMKAEETGQIVNKKVG